MKEMDFEKLRGLVVKCRNAAFKAGLERGRAEADAMSADLELEMYLQECEAESRKPIVERKNIVVQGEPLPPQPPTERRCRNCWHFLSPLPYGRETAKAGKCMARNVGSEFANAMDDLDHSWCTLWEPAEEEQKKTQKEEQPEKTPEAPSDEEEDKEVDGDGRCGDCVHYSRSQNWCCGHDMPTTPDNGVTCGDFIPGRPLKEEP